MSFFLKQISFLLQQMLSLHSPATAAAAGQSPSEEDVREAGRRPEDRDEAQEDVQEENERHDRHARALITHPGAVPRRVPRPANGGKERAAHLMVCREGGREEKKRRERE